MRKSELMEILEGVEGDPEIKICDDYGSKSVGPLVFVEEDESGDEVVKLFID